MHARLFFVACASAALLSAGACNNSNSATNTDQTKPAPDTTAATKGTTGAEDAQKPMTLTGCLQKGDGSDYILTQINEPSAGTVAPADGKVEREQLNAAEHSYRLNAKGDTNDDGWSKLVGRQVRVEGTLAKNGDLTQKVGTTGSNDRTDNDRDRVKIHDSDLAQVDVNNIQQIAAACGSHGAKASAKSAKPRRK